MADNYLEKRYEEVFGRDAGHRKVPGRPGLDTLLLHNRSFRGYDKSYVVHRRQLEAMIAVNPKVASSINLQRLRFRPVVQGPEADLVNAHIRMGRGLPELHLPFPGTEPEAFIVVCSTVPENPGIDIDLGISLQSMLLKAVEMGLGGLMIRNFDREPIREGLGLPFEPVCVVAVGKPAEQIELVPVHQGEDLGYYRRDGVHFVPKLTAEDLTL
ncbi:MAG: nitroreductase family protein [Bacteroidales bacterium]|nr:nitroreductase family protein [Bacteroidales bacterium]